MVNAMMSIGRRSPVFLERGQQFRLDRRDDGTPPGNGTRTYTV
jgi:hypothetical protein